MDIEILKNKNGFSLLEIITVLGIISVGLLGISTLVIQSMQAKNVNQNYLVASMLAQEGIELVRNIRDENWLVDRSSWKYGDAPAGDFDIVQDKKYVIDYGNGIPAVIKDQGGANVNDITDPGARLYLNSSGFYTHNSTNASSTPFSRLVTVVDNNSPSDVVTITVEVRWDDRGKMQNYKAETMLYNWR